MKTIIEKRMMMESDYEQQAFRDRISIGTTGRGDPISPDDYYDLRGTCKGCRRVTWLCRRDRRCRKYATTPARGHVVTPTGYKKPNAKLSA